MSRQTTGETRTPIRLAVDAHPLMIALWGPARSSPLMCWTARTLQVGRTRDVRVHRFIAWDFFRERGRRRQPLRHLLSDTSEPGRRILELGATPHRADLRMTLDWLEPDHVRWRLELLQPDHNRIGWGFEDDAKSHLVGFGERTHPIADRARFDDWVEEGPVGLGRWSRWLRWTGRVPLPKGGYTTPAPMPWWLSAGGYLAWLDTYAMVRFHKTPTRLQAWIWARRVEGHLLVGPTPKALLRRGLDIIGHPSLPPPWVFAPWNDSVGGQQAAEDLLQRLRRERIPSSVLWVEDWMGSHEDGRRFWMRPLSHRLDRERYPAIERMADGARAQGFRLLGYFCPEVTEATPLYHEALAGGHLVVDRAGKPLTVRILGIHHGELNLSQAKTQSFVRERMLAPAADLGFDGWMADFGEYFPVHAVLGAGLSGWAAHNRYPVWWQTIHRDFWQQRRPDGDYAYLSRSANLGSPPVASIFWGGDSDTDWDEADGLPTVVPQLLSAGLAGLPFWGTDIAGYMTFGLTAPSTKELYLRWTELGALCPIMRTHHGTARPRNWHFLKDTPTLALYTRYARLHTALAPYWYRLAQIAVESGTPLARPLFLEYPELPPTWALPPDEFLVGSDLLVAPVVRAGQRSRACYFPPGVWYDWWTGQSVAGPGWHRVWAPLDRIPLFIRQGSVLPLFEGNAEEIDGHFCPDGIVDTLAPAPGWNDWTTVNRTVTLLITDLHAKAKVCLFDGSVLEVAPAGAGVRSSGRALIASPPGRADHLPGGGVDGIAARLAPGDRLVMNAHAGRLALTLLEGPCRWYIMRRFPSARKSGSAAADDSKAGSGEPRRDPP